MEKFTVDLEKVLDDFEFSEERDERKSIASNNNVVNSQFSLPKNNMVSNNYEYSTPAPAGIYKRPSFEPINLAEADYSAAAPLPSAAPLMRSTEACPSQNEISTRYVFPAMTSGANVILKSVQDTMTGSGVMQNSVTPTGSHVTQNRMDQIYAQSPLPNHPMSPIEDNHFLDMSVDDVLSSSSSDTSPGGMPKAGRPVHKEDKRHYLPSGPSSFLSSCELGKLSPEPPDLPVEPRLSLPDVATEASTVTPKPSDKFDLINDRVLSAIVDSSSSDAAGVVGKSGANGASGVVGFGDVARSTVLSESELNKYLDELEEENSVEEVSSLPVVSTDEDISSSQSQLDEVVTSTSSSGDARLPPCGGNTDTEFEALLSPESSTASSNLVPQIGSQEVNHSAADVTTVDTQLNFQIQSQEVNHNAGDTRNLDLYTSYQEINHGLAVERRGNVETRSYECKTSGDRGTGVGTNIEQSVVGSSDNNLKSESISNVRDNVEKQFEEQEKASRLKEDRVGGTTNEKQNVMNVMIEGRSHVDTDLNINAKSVNEKISRFPVAESIENVIVVEQEESREQILVDKKLLDENELKDKTTNERVEERRIEGKYETLMKTEEETSVESTSLQDTSKLITGIQGVSIGHPVGLTVTKTLESIESIINDDTSVMSNQTKLLDERIEQNEHLLNAKETEESVNERLIEENGGEARRERLNEHPSASRNEEVKTDELVKKETMETSSHMNKPHEGSSSEQSIPKERSKHNLSDFDKEYSRNNPASDFNTYYCQANSDFKTDYSEASSDFKTDYSSTMEEQRPNEPTEILNTKYVVEISRPSLGNDPSKSKPIENDALPCFIPDSAIQNAGKQYDSETILQNASKEYDSNTVEPNTSTISMSEQCDRSQTQSQPNKTNENSSNERIENSVQDVEQTNKHTVEHIQNNINETINSSSCETKSNLPENSHNESIVSQCTGEDDRVSNASETSSVNMTNRNQPTQNTVPNKFQNHFVHNDLEMVREKNTNLEPKRKSSNSLDTSCISVCNLKDSKDVSTKDISNVGNPQDVPQVRSVSEPNNVQCVSPGADQIQGDSEQPGPSHYGSEASPDCYIEEKSIADSIQNDNAAQVMVHSAQHMESQPVNTSDASSSSVPEIVSNPQPSSCPELTIQVDQPSSPSSGSQIVSPKPVRPNSLDLPSSPSVSLSPSETPPNLSDSEQGGAVVEAGGESSSPAGQDLLGKRAPYWVPDTEAPQCMHCAARFTLVKRRHHCRACGQVLCSRCCNRKAPLEYLQQAQERVCLVCYELLMNKPASGAQPSRPGPRQPNPNNPMEYCSTIPPLEQAAQTASQHPPSVLVPVSVLKREGSLKSREGNTKQVMFSDGIKPGGDLTELDCEAEVTKLPIVKKRSIKRVGTPPGNLFHKRPLHPDTNSFIPSVGLPPIIQNKGGEISYSEVLSPIGVGEESVKFAIHRNLFAHVQKLKLDCCMGKKKYAWNVTSEGLNCVGQDEVVFLLSCTPGEVFPSQHIFHVILYIYTEAAQGSIVTEMCFLPCPPTVQELLGSKDHGGFIFIRRTSQCVSQLKLPDPPYLFGVLVHRWEIPWAKLFPLRLVLRLGAAYKCYPCPLLSARHREPVYVELGHTIITLLADFRSYAYSLPSVRGLLIHMEETKTSVIIPKNYYDQVVKAINLSNESHLAFAGNFSAVADSHLVCVQNIEAESSEYSTQRMESHRETSAGSCTGLAFILFNASLNSSDGMSGKARISEDGLMVHLLPEGMTSLRSALHDMRDYTVLCGPQGEESVDIVWGPQDLAFNVGVMSCIDGKPLDGVQSIRVHGGTDYTGGLKLIRWTEVFILENSDLNAKTTEDPIDHMKKLSENISRATCVSLVPLLESLSSGGVAKFAVRVTIHADDVGYEAGTGGERFDAKYMRVLDEGLVPIIHQAGVHATHPLTLELVFRIMEQG
uniref:Zinc finger FYVE domain-containing protein 9 n=1 Tax=Cacopsylla melanoneura TaxID=428564 RepID=A0A8D8WRK3_9HEMI